MLWFLLALIAEASRKYPAIKHPADVNVTVEMADRIYAALDQDGMRPTAIEIVKADLFDVQTPMVLVFGDLKKSSATVCRGSVVTYEQNESTGRWQRVPLASYAVLPARDCGAPPKSASRVLIDDAIADGDITAIIDAIRAGRVALDPKGARPKLPPFTTRAIISGVQQRGESAVVRIASRTGEEKSLLMVREGRKWYIATAGNDIVLPER